jgi:hypothetical protein
MKQESFPHGAAIDSWCFGGENDLSSIVVLPTSDILAG